MTDEQKTTDSQQLDRCPLCGQNTKALVNGRCSLCGHVVLQRGTTGDDSTPYARSRIEGRPGWRQMCGWVFGASESRLAHLVLVRSSTHSRRFARINFLVFTMLVFLISFALSGWHIVNEGPGTMSVRKTPAGDGWCKLYDNPVAAAQLEKGDIVAAELWWNPSAAAITAVAAGIVVLVMGLVFFSLIVRGASKSLRQQSGSEDRLRCALHYGTAWLNFLNVALIILCFRPLGRIHGVFGWRFIASNAVFDVPAALLILAGLLLWWFWLVPSWRCHGR